MTKTPELDLVDMSAVIREHRLQFEEAIAPLRAELWRYCRHLTGSVWDAEDLVQDTLVRAFAKLSHIYGQAVPARAYLFRIASNLWIDRQRRATVSTVAVDDWDSATGFGSEDMPDLVPAFESMITRLPPRQRVVLLLTEAFGFTARDVAKMLGTTAGAVKIALHRARFTLSQGHGSEQHSEELALDYRVLERFSQLFHDRDIDGLVSLLGEDVEVEIVGVADEMGREEARRSSLHEWSKEWAAHTGRILFVEGEPVLVTFTDATQRTVNNVIRLRTVEGEVTKMRDYYFCPELMAELSAMVDSGYENHGYHYRGSAS